MTQQGLSAQLLKACCAEFYQDDLVRTLLGDTLHPGGLVLTRRLGHSLELRAGERVLDVACGRGASTILLAQEFGCHVVGIDYGAANITMARNAAAQSGIDHEVAFRQGDAELLSEGDEAYDALICECALSTFPDKASALAEMHRVLSPGGRLGITDVTVNSPLPQELAGLAASVACIGQALSQQGYEEAMENQKLHDITITDCSDALRQLIQDIHRRVLLARMAASSGILNLNGLDLDQALHLLQTAQEQVQQGVLGYMLLIARKLKESGK